MPLEGLPLISVIILNYSGRSFIENCIKTVLNSDYPLFETILVDNGSKDDSVELVKKKFGKDNHLRIIRNHDNFGVAKGFNIGLSSSKGDIIVFLNNDTEVEPNWLRELEKLFTSHEDVGAAQCLLLQISDRRSVQGTGVLLEPLTGWPVPRPTVRPRSDELCDIIAGSAAFAIRRNVINEVGTFDQDYFTNFEDVDLCLRIFMYGYRVVLASNSIVYHYDYSMHIRPHVHSSAYFKEQRVVREFHSVKNLISTLLKNCEIKNIIKYLPTTLVFTFTRGLYFATKQRDAIVLLATIRGFIWPLTNIKKILKKRHFVQSLIRKVSDKQVIERVGSKKMPIF